jgi:hypothetical protein
LSSSSASLSSPSCSTASGELSSSSNSSPVHTRMVRMASRA